MPHEIRRREFLSLAAGVGLGLPALLDVVQAATTEPLSTESGAPSNDGMWDYLARPVVVRNPGLKDNWNVGAQFAFDGYGGSVRPDSISHA